METVTAQNNIVKIECPSCGGEISIDESKEFGFCMYCGTKIYIPNAVQRIKGTVSIDNSSQVHNLLLRVDEFVASGKLEEAKAYCNKILDIDINCKEARYKLNRIITEPNVTMRFLSNKYRIRYLIINDEVRESITHNGTYELTLPVGAYTLKFYDSNSVSFEIIDCFTRIRITVQDKLFGYKVFLNQ